MNAVLDTQNYISTLMRALLIFCGLASVMALAAPVSFKTQIAPILRAQCQSCHGAQEAKGDYRVDSFAEVMSAQRPVRLVRPSITPWRGPLSVRALARRMREVLPPTIHPAANHREGSIRAHSPGKQLP